MRSPRRTPAMLGAVIALAGCAVTDAPAEQRPPNIVVVMTDDQDLPSLQAMPNVLRLLARQGTTFQNFLVTFPVCCPARATLLTGQYSHNHGVRDNFAPFGGAGAFVPAEPTALPVALRGAGYRTIHIGKYLNGYDGAHVPPGWDDWNASVGASTNRMYGYTLNHNGTLRTYGQNEEPAEYQTDVYARLASAKVTEAARADAPFYLSVATLAPHTEVPRPANGQVVRPAPRHNGRYAGRRAPRAPSFNEADVSDKPAFAREYGRLTTGEIQALDKRHRERLEALLAVDELVAGIVEALRKAGELDDTVIMFTSDNGWFEGQHRFPGGKWYVHEPASRVPLVVRGPGFPRGVRRRQLVANVDLAPTILDLAGIEPLRPVDGTSLLPLADDGGLRPGRDILIESGPSAAHDLPVYQSLRTDRWIWVEYDTGERELYDLDEDPDQLRSLHGETRLEGLRRELTRRLADLRTCSGRGCRRAPAVKVSLRCSRGRITARLRGSDARRVARVSFVRGGRTVARDRRRPFRGRFSDGRGRRGRVEVRARITLSDGIEMTRDKRVRRCG